MVFKKLASVLMAGAILASCAIPAIAAEDPTKDVTGSYKAGAQGGKPVYSYSYSFGSMEFTYNGPSEAGNLWNPSTHAYDGAAGEASEGGWSCASGANDITVTNHSNAAVRVQASFEAKKDGFKGGFTKNNFTIATAEGTTVAEAPKETFQFGPAEGSAVLAEGDENVVLGTITLHVAGA